MISIRFYLHTPKKVQSPLYVRVHVDGTGLTPMSTGISLKTGWVESKQNWVGGDWNHDKQVVKASHDYAPELNSKIERLRIRIGQEFLAIQEKGGNPTSYELKLIVNPKAAAKVKSDKPKQLVTISDYYEAWGKAYIKKRGKTEEAIQKAKNYVRGFKQIVDKINLFLPGAKLSDFEPDYNNFGSFGLIEEFEEWVKDEYLLQDNTVVRYRKPIRAFLKFAGRPYEWLELNKRVKPTKYSLEWDEILLLHEGRYSSKAIEGAAHVSIIICQLGLRWGDFSRLKDLHFRKIKTERNGEVWVIDKNQSKSGNQLLVPVPPLSLSYLNKYDFKLPIPRTKAGVAYRHELSELMKKAAEEAGLKRLIRVTKSYNEVISEYESPIYKIFSPHDCRHTGATLVRTASKSKDLQRLFLGHKESDATSMYDHMPPEIIADDILDAWAYYDKKADKKANKN